MGVIHFSLPCKVIQAIQRSLEVITIIKTIMKILSQQHFYSLCSFPKQNNFHHCKSYFRIAHRYGGSRCPWDGLQSSIALPSVPQGRHYMGSSSHSFFDQRAGISMLKSHSLLLWLIPRMMNYRNGYLTAIGEISKKMVETNYPVENNSSTMGTLALFTIDTFAGIAASTWLLNTTIWIEINMPVWIQWCYVTRMNYVNILVKHFRGCITIILAMVNWI